MKRILVIRFSSLGDIVLTEPVTRALKQNFSAAIIDYLTKPQYSALVSMFGSLDQSRDRIKPWRGDKFFRETMEDLRSANYDLLVDLHNNIRSSRVRTAIPAKSVKAGKDWLKRFAAVNLKKLTSPPRAALARYADALAGVNISLELGVPRLRVPDSASDWWQVERERVKLNHGYVVFAAGARYPTKQAPGTLWLSIAQQLAELSLEKIVIIGAPHETKSLEEVAGLLSKRCIHVITPADLSRSAAILASARAVVSNDTGPSHIAAALNVPTVSLFGPTHPILGFAPLGKHASAYSVDEYCSPCSLHGEKTCYRDRRYCFVKMDAEEIVGLLRERGV